MFCVCFFTEPQSKVKRNDGNRSLTGVDSDTDWKRSGSKSKSNRRGGVGDHSAKENSNHRDYGSNYDGSFHGIKNFSTIDAGTDTSGFKFCQICVGLTEGDNLECDLPGVIPAPATVTNQNGSFGPHTHAQAQHLTPPVINRNNSMVKNDIESCEFGTIRCIFGGNMDGIGLQYDMFSGMFVFVFLFICFLIVL